jgi:hypothetical protein
MSAWREALRAMHVQLVAEVWAGTVVLLALGVLWLQVPDSHVWEVAFSLLFASVLLALFFWFYSRVFKRMLKPVEEERWWLQWILFAVVIVVWWLLQMPIDKLVEHRELYAGYWTSRLPHGLRGLRTHEHWMVLQNWIYFSLRLIVTGLLLPVAVVAVASRLHARQIFGMWSRWWYWVTVLACGWIAFAVSSKILNWFPGRGLKGEMFSLLARLGFVFTLDVLLACFVLAVIAVGLRRTHSPASSSDL